MDSPNQKTLDGRKEAVRQRIGRWIWAHEKKEYVITIQPYGQGGLGWRINLLLTDAAKGQSPLVFSTTFGDVTQLTPREISTGFIGQYNLKRKSGKTE